MRIHTLYIPSVEPKSFYTSYSYNAIPQPEGNPYNRPHHSPADLVLCLRFSLGRWMVSDGIQEAERVVAAGLAPFEVQSFHFLFF